MAALFAPPELLSVFSCATDGSDPDLAKGTHLRVFTGLGASFPLAPLAVFKIATRPAEPHGLHVTDRDGKLAGGIVLAQLGVADVTPMLGDTLTNRTVRVDLRPDVDSGLTDVQLLDQHGRIVAERGTGPYQFSAPMLHRFRLSGNANFVNITTRTVDISDIVLQRTPRPPERLLGLPLRGIHPWYLGVLDRQDGIDRVTGGAPMRLGVMDRPVGPFDPLTPADELARVEAMLRSAEFGGGLEQLMLDLIDDRSNPPWLQIAKQRMATGTARADQVAEVPRLANLQMAAIDPGLARFLGFADHIDDLPARDGNGWDALLVAGVFAIDPERFDPTGRLGLQDADPDERALLRLIASSLATRGGDNAADDLATLIAGVRAQGLVVRAMVAVTAPTAPWLPPSLPRPLLTEHRWQTAVDDQPSARYRVSFVFHDAPLAAMAAMAAEIDGAAQSRHATVAVDDADVPLRATPRIFGREQAAWTSTRALGTPSASAHHGGLLADHDLPADAGMIPYRCWASDVFGRFGKPAAFDVAPPPRPAPPPPVLRFHLAPADVDPAALDGRSPGSLTLSFAVPQPPPGDRFAAADRDRLASAIVVPMIADLAAGSLAIAQASISLDGVTQTVDVTDIGLIDLVLPLPSLLPKETRTLTLGIAFIDSAGTSSDVALQPVKIVDRRPPQVIETGVGLFWTSAPGPAPEVELQLAWPAPAKSLHRVYVTDQQGLGLTPADLAEPVPGASPSRGRVAEVGCNKVLGGAPVNRANFRLLTETPVEAGGDGRAVLRTALPRSLEVVQFLRVVPLSAEGAEAPFGSCGIVPVAVPESRRPAPPRLDGSVDPATGFATLTVIAEAFDGIALRRDEPGLFEAGAAPAASPEFRIRRAVGAVADPIYGRPVAAGMRDRGAEAPDPLFEASVSDDNAGRGLEPFVRYVYWADVRLPPERRLPAGVVPLDPPGGVAAVDPANGANHVRPMSLPSAPRVLMNVPPAPPAAIAEAAITATRNAPDGAGTIRIGIAIADMPKAHAKAIGPYRLAVWTQWPDRPIEPVQIVDGVALGGVWPAPNDGSLTLAVAAPTPPVAPASAIQLRFAVVDPLGRMGDLTTIEVPAGV